MTKIRGVIFDADGMVVLHGQRFSDRLAASYGIEMSKITPFFTGPFQECLIGKEDLRSALEQFIPLWAWKGSVDDILSIWFDEKFNQIDTRFKEVTDILAKKNIKRYLATNNEKYRTTNLTEERGIGAWFERVFSSADAGSKKPEPEFFEHIISTTGFSKEELLFWDDDPENLAGAVSFGMPSELYSDFEQFKQKMSAYIA